MDGGVDLFKVIVTIGSITYSVIFGILAKKIFDVPKTIEKRLEEFQLKFEERFDRVDEEARLAHRRLNVHDRISSKLSAKDFDSRAIAESGQFPEIRTRVRNNPKDSDV